MAQSLDLSKQSPRPAWMNSIIQMLYRNKWLFIVACTAGVLNLFMLQLYSLNGDEYNTITETQMVGLNWTSILYFIFMHAWSQFGISELVLRLPAALCGVLAAITLYAAGRKLAGERASIAAGLLAATSPFLVYHSQEARFYSFFIFATSLFIYITMHFFGRGIQRKRDIFTLAACALLVVLSHFLGAIAILAQGLAAITSVFARRFGWRVYVFTALLFSALFVVPMLPPVQAVMWQFYQNYAHTTTASTPITTALSVVSIFKIIISLYIFSLGYHVYPLWWFVAVPGVLFTGFLLITGLIWIFKHSSWGAMPVLFGIALLGAYLVLDPIGGRLASGISPRHVAFVWPAYLLVIAVGVASLPRRVYYSLLCILIALNIVALYPRWNQMWSYSGLLDYRSAATFARTHSSDKTVILHDGRVQDAVAFYFPSDIPRKNFWPYLQNGDFGELSGYQRIILVTNDYQPMRRQETDRILVLLSDQFTLSTGRIECPLFEYVLERKPIHTMGFDIDPVTRQVRQPVSIYGLEFQDLRLPVQMMTQGQTLTIVGALSVPDLEGQREVVLPLAEAVEVRRLILLSNIVGAEHIVNGQQIASVDIETAGGSVQTVPLRYGKEIQDWSLACDDKSACQAVYSWQKRVAFVGQQRYPGSAQDFQAHIHATSLVLPVEAKITRLSFNYTAPTGRLYIWGIALAQ